METGKGFVRFIGPLGCVLFLGLTVLTVLMCFTLKGAPLEGYTAPNTSEYYSENISELAEEIRDNLMPLAGVRAEIIAENGKVTVFGTEDSVEKLQMYILHYYEKDLFRFVTLDS